MTCQFCHAFYLLVFVCPLSVTVSVLSYLSTALSVSSSLMQSWVLKADSELRKMVFDSAHRFQKVEFLCILSLFMLVSN